MSDELTPALLRADAAWLRRYDSGERAVRAAAALEEQAQRLEQGEDDRARLATLEAQRDALAAVAAACVCPAPAGVATAAYAALAAIAADQTTTTTTTETTGNGTT